MKTRYSLMAIMAVLLAMVSTGVLAQRQGGHQDRGGQTMRQQQVQRDRAFDRDRMAQRGQQVERGQKAGESRGEQDQLRDRDRGQLRDQDRTHRTEMASGMSDTEPVYGNEIMTDAERSRYRERLQLAATDEEKARLKSEHQEMMQTRARQLGVDLPPPAQGDPAALRAEEQNRYRKEIGNPGEGETIRKRSEEQVQPRLDDPGPRPDMDPEPE